MTVEDKPLRSQEMDDIARRIDRPIALVGMMGVGKSTVGKRLAAYLHCPFTDADDAIEASAQMAIPEIFAQFGEPYFRDGERRVIARLIEDSHRQKRAAHVIATGGGAFCHAETRAILLDRAITVWLDSDIDTLVERTARKDNRPLLQQGNPREVLTRLHAERAPHYAQAPIRVRSSGGPHERTVERVLRGIAEWL